MAMVSDTVSRRSRLLDLNDPLNESPHKGRVDTPVDSLWKDRALSPTDLAPTNSIRHRRTVTSTLSASPGVRKSAAAGSL